MGMKFEDLVFAVFGILFSGLGIYRILSSGFLNKRIPRIKIQRLRKYRLFGISRISNKEFSNPGFRGQEIHGFSVFSGFGILQISLISGFFHHALNGIPDPKPLK